MLSSRGTPSLNSMTESHDPQLLALPPSATASEGPDRTDGRLLLVRLQSLKRRGDYSSESGNYRDAIDRYTEAMELLPAISTTQLIGASAAWKEMHSEVRPVLLSNRSWALCKAGRYQAALNDAVQLRNAKPGWVKGHIRMARALEGLQRYAEAARQFAAAYRLESGSPVGVDCVKAANLALQRLSSHELAQEMLSIAQAALQSNHMSTQPDPEKYSATDASTSALAAVQQHIQHMPAGSVAHAAKMLVSENVRPQQAHLWPPGSMHRFSLRSRLLAWLQQGEPPRHEAALLLAAAWHRACGYQAALDAAACAGMQIIAVLTGSQVQARSVTDQEALVDMLSEVHFVQGAAYAKMAADRPNPCPRRSTDSAVSSAVSSIVSSAVSSTVSSTVSSAVSSTVSSTSSSTSSSTHTRGGQRSEQSLLWQSAIVSFTKAVQLSPGSSSYQTALLQATASLGDGDAAMAASSAAKREGPLIVVPALDVVGQGSMACSHDDTIATITMTPSSTAQPTMFLHTVSGCLALSSCTAQDLTSEARRAILEWLQKEAMDPAASAHIVQVKQTGGDDGQAVLLHFEVDLGAEVAAAKQLLAALMTDEPLQTLHPAHGGSLPRNATATPSAPDVGSMTAEPRVRLMQAQIHTREICNHLAMRGICAATTSEEAASDERGLVQYRLVTVDGKPYEGPCAGVARHPFGLSRVFYDSKDLPDAKQQAWCQMDDGSCRWRQSASEIQIIALKVPPGLPAKRLSVTLGPHSLLVKDKVTGKEYLQGKLHRGVLPSNSFWTMQADDGNSHYGKGCHLTLAKMNLELLAKSWRHAEAWWPRLFEDHSDLSWDAYEKDNSDLPPELLQQHSMAARRREGMDEHS